MSHAGALLIAILVPDSLLVRVLLAGLIVVSLFWQWRHGSWRPAGSIRLGDDGYCFFDSVDAAGARRQKILHATRHAGLIRLLLKAEGRRTRRLLIARDALDPDSYRELSARILQGRLPRRDQASA